MRSAAALSLVVERTTRLVPFTERHLTDRYVSWLSDPEVVKFSEQRHRRHTFESCKEYVLRAVSDLNRLWAIESDGEHVGNVSAVVNGPNRTVEINILIGECRGQGIGTSACEEAVRLMIRAGFRKVWMETLSCNLPMLRVMEKIGLEPDGVTKRHFVVGGVEVDAIRMARFA